MPSRPSARDVVEVTRLRKHGRGRNVTGETIVPRRSVFVRAAWPASVAQASSDPAGSSSADRAVVSDRNSPSKPALSVASASESQCSHRHASWPSIIRQTASAIQAVQTGKMRGTIARARATFMRNTGRSSSPDDRPRRRRVTRLGRHDRRPHLGSLRAPPFATWSPTSSPTRRSRGTSSRCSQTRASSTARRCRPRARDELLGDDVRPAAEADGHVRIRIFTPAIEVPFAGHPVLGAAFVLGGAAAEDRDPPRDRQRHRASRARARRRAHRVRLHGSAAADGEYVRARRTSCSRRSASRRQSFRSRSTTTACSTCTSTP